MKFSCYQVHGNYNNLGKILHANFPYFREFSRVFLRVLI